MKLTEKSTLELTIRQWKWLEENPNMLKRSWPEWKFNGGKIPVMSANCPCCEYRDQQELNCKECLLIELWNDYSGYFKSDTPCCAGISPYKKWYDVITEEDYEESSKQARIIWQGAERKLEEIELLSIPMQIGETMKKNNIFKKTYLGVSAVLFLLVTAIVFVTYVITVVIVGTSIIWAPVLMVILGLKLMGLF